METPFFTFNLFCLIREIPSTNFHSPQTCILLRKKEQKEKQKTTSLNETKACIFFKKNDTFYPIFSHLNSKCDNADPEKKFCCTPPSSLSLLVLSFFFILKGGRERKRKGERERERKEGSESLLPSGDNRKVSQNCHWKQNSMFLVARNTEGIRKKYRTKKCHIVPNIQSLNPHLL